MNTQKLNRKTKMENREMNNQLQIELKEDVAQGTYANLAVITHSSSEFIVDFVRVMPGMPKASVKSRIVLAPEHAMARELATEETKQAVEDYIYRASTRSNIDRMADKEKTGVFTGSYAINPLN